MRLTTWQSGDSGHKPKIGHLPVESAVTFGRNGRSRSLGISGHDDPEYAIVTFASVALQFSGAGKTHLAISLAIAAAQRGRRVYYGTLVDLITSLEEAQAAGQLARRLAVLTHRSLLVVDEIGYLPISRVVPVLFFQLMNRHYETASTVLTSNKRFEGGGVRR